MIIEVTQDDIRNGVKGDTCACPVALALQRYFSTYIQVDAYVVAIGLEQIELPVKVKTFIKDFDNGHTVCPFAFELSAGPMAERGI